MTSAATDASGLASIRVLVGPFSNRAVALSAITALEAEGWQGFVSSYPPAVQAGTGKDDTPSHLSTAAQATLGDGTRQVMAIDDDEDDAGAEPDTPITPIAEQDLKPGSPQIPSIPIDETLIVDLIERGRSAHQRADTETAIQRFAQAIEYSKQLDFAEYRIDALMYLSDAWDNDVKDLPETDEEELASVGLGLLWNPLPGLHGELFWGHALTDVDEPSEYDLQDDGVHFRLAYTVF